MASRIAGMAHLGDPEHRRAEDVPRPVRPQMVGRAKGSCRTMFGMLGASRPREASWWFAINVLPLHPQDVEIQADRERQRREHGFLLDSDDSDL